MGPPAFAGTTIFDHYIRSAFSAALRLVDEHDRRALLDIAAQQTHAPVGQPDATVGFRLADLGRVGRTMDAESLRGQPDPIGPHRVVGPGLDRERFPGFYALEFVIGIVAVVRVGIGGDDLETAARRRFLLAADG